jgi:hypothetical protein
MSENKKVSLKFKVIFYTATHLFVFGLIGIGYFLGAKTTKEQIRGKRFEDIEIQYMKFLKENEKGATKTEEDFLKYLELIYGM